MLEQESSLKLYGNWDELCWELSSPTSSDIIPAGFPSKTSQLFDKNIKHYVLLQIMFVQIWANDGNQYNSYYERTFKGLFFPIVIKSLTLLKLLNLTGNIYILVLS